MNNLPYNFHLDKTGFIPEIPMNDDELRDNAERMLVTMAEASGRDIEDLRETTTISTRHGKFSFSGF